jgi:hypothetical protein
MGSRSRGQSSSSFADARGCRSTTCVADCARPFPPCRTTFCIAACYAGASHVWPKRSQRGLLPKITIDYLYIDVYEQRWAEGKALMFLMSSLHPVATPARRRTVPARRHRSFPCRLQTILINNSIPFIDQPAQSLRKGLSNRNAAFNPRPLLHENQGSEIDPGFSSHWHENGLYRWKTTRRKIQRDTDLT